MQLHRQLEFSYNATWRIKHKTGAGDAYTRRETMPVGLGADG